MRQRQFCHSAHAAKLFDTLDDEIAFAEVQLAVYGGNLGPHHGRDQQQVVVRLHRHLDGLEAKRRSLLERQP